jgi:hypothetical protein
MIGDSFLRRIRENVDLSLSSEYSAYSMVKPGCELNTLLESANSTTGVLTQKDVIVICGESNDLNQKKVKSAISCIREFKERHNHTNIIIANVPIRYDLSYHSLTNKEIRLYNAELLELASEPASEHGQITIIELDFKRKFHTRHGLHFNKQGKLFSNKIVQAIHTMLGKRLEHKIEIDDKGVSQEQKKQEVTNSDSEDNGEEGNCSHTNGELVLTRAPLGDDKNSEGTQKQENQEITNSDSVSTSEVGKCSQITDEVTEMQDSEDEDEGRAETGDQVELEEINSNSNDKSKITELRTSGRV